MDTIIVITGPTATGKTKASVTIAKHFNGEIINADSTQIYKELDIATAKITEEEKEDIKHHLFDIKNIEEDYAVYDYQKDCRQKINEIKKQNKTPILVGGTGLYIKAALYDYQFLTETTKQDYSKYNDEEIYQQLIKFNPNTDIHPNNRKRIERALDKYYNNEEETIQNGNKPLYNVIFIGLTLDRETLYQRINKRTDIMLESGLLEEAKKIYDSNIRTKAITTPIGYKELFPYFENKATLEECLDKIKQNCRRYAKRQYTWFNNQMNVKWFTVNLDNFDETINQIIEYIEKEC